MSIDSLEKSTVDRCRIDTYEEYMDYQKEMWKNIKGQLPIEWEIFNWLEEAKIQNPV